ANPVPRRPVAAAVDPQDVERIRSSADLAELEGWLRAGNSKLVEEAVLRLLELGEEGVARLAQLLVTSPPTATTITLASTLSLWPEGASLERVRSFVGAPNGPPELRFLAGLGLVKKGETALLNAVFDAACRETEPPWFRPEDWQALLELGLSERAVARQ